MPQGPCGFALKVLYPDRVVLIRGNHEFRSMSDGMGEEGFLQHVKKTFANVAGWDVAYEACHAAFDFLPLAALVESRILILHGGLGDGSFSLSDLATIARPLRDDSVGPNFLTQVLWSDPSGSDAFMARGVHRNPRGSSIAEFGPDITERFCKRNGVDVVIRSHQVVEEGVKFMHSGRIITVFSARNYCGDDFNDGACLLIVNDTDRKVRIQPKRLFRR